MIDSSEMTNNNQDLAFSIGNWEESHQPTSNSNVRHHPTEESLQLVHSIAQRMSHGREDVEDDLMQEGVVALMNAMNHYTTLTRNTEPFERYAKRQIISEMQKSVNTSSMVVPPQISALLKSAQRIRRRESQKLNREPTLTEIAVILQIDPKDLERYEKMKKEMVSVESTLETDDPDEVIKIFTDQDRFDKRHTTEESDVMWEEEDEEQVWLQPAAPLKQLIMDRDELTPEDDAFQSMIRTDVHEFLSDHLNDIENKVVSMHFGLQGEALSWKETAKRLKTTKQFVQSIEKDAMEKLRTSYGIPYVGGEYQEHNEDIN